MANDIIRIMELLRRTVDIRGLKLVIIGLGALLYNNWVLGDLLNPNLFINNGSVSEFSIPSQPYSLIFRSLDIISGLLIIITARLFLKELRQSKLGKWLLATTAVLGLANILDALNTLPCSETLSSRCNIPVSISWSHYQVPTHGYSSTIIALCYFVLPLLGLIYGLKRRLWFISLISFAAATDALISFAYAAANYVQNHSLSVRTSGTGQEVEMIILAIWLVGFYVSTVRHQPAQLAAQEEG